MSCVLATNQSDAIKEVRSDLNCRTQHWLFSHTFLCSLQLKVQTIDKPGNTVNFRKLLLNRCQKEFEKDKDDDEIFEKKQRELEAASEVKNMRCHPSPALFFLLREIQALSSRGSS